MYAGRPDLLSLVERVRALPPAERSAFLDRACGDNAGLRAEVVALFESQTVQSLESSHAGARLTVQQTNTRAALRLAGVRGGDADIATDPRVGRSIAHYRILEKIGGGGMGDVYKAHDRKLDRVVALKFLPAAFSQDELARSRFLLEARAVSALDHANICSIYDIVEGPGHLLFISMGYCDGETLHAKLRPGPLRPPEALDYARQIARGLAHAHAHGIIHRDIKPANLIVNADGIVKIVDFGVARVADIHLTRAGAIVGTVAYMSPEQIRDETVDHRTDVWALGVVLYEMLTGVPPFAGEYDLAVMYAVLNEKPRPITAYLPGAPLKLMHVINRMLEKSVDRRYQRAENVAQDITALQKRYATVLPRQYGAALAESLHDPDPAWHAYARTPGRTPHPALHHPVRILVVDDEPDVELLLRQRFLKRVQSHEWGLVFATDGHEALRILDSEPDGGRHPCSVKRTGRANLPCGSTSG